MITSPSLSESATAPPVAKTCTGCFRELPVEQFRIRYKATGQRHARCRDCFNQYRTTVHKGRQKRRRLSTSVTALASRESRGDVGLLSLIARRMVTHFGGVERMCDYWAREVRALAARRPGSRLAIKTFQALMHMLALVEQVERKEAGESVSNMSTEQLTELLEWLAKQRPPA